MNPHIGFLIGCSLLSLTKARSSNGLPRNAEPSLQHYSISNQPNLHIPSEKLRFKEQWIQDKALTKSEILQNSKIPLQDIYSCLRDLQEVYSEIQVIEKTEQERLQKINKLNKEIQMQELITEQLKEEQSQQGLKNKQLSTNILDQENRLYKLKKEKFSIEQNLNELENMLQKDIQRARIIEEAQSDSSKRTVTDESVNASKELKENGTLQGNVVIDKRREIPFQGHAISTQNSTLIHDVVPKLKLEVEGLQSRIEELEKALHRLLVTNNM